MALAAASVLIVASAVSISETATAAKPTDRGAQVSKRYCYEYIYEPYGPGQGSSVGTECVHSEAFCEQIVADLKTRPAYTVTNDSCYKKIVVTTTTPR